MRRLITMFVLFSLTAATLWAEEKPPLRVAVIGGMTMSGLWPKVAEAFEKRYGIPVELVVTGPKSELDDYTRTHPVDLVTMHASDTMVDLAADGFVERLTPWGRNAQMLVGHRNNPAGIAPGDTLPEALRKISLSKAPFLVHASGGTFEVYSALRSRYRFNPQEEQIHFTVKKMSFLNDVARLEGYTLYGVIPFLMKKQSHPQIRGFAFDDPALRRPYLAAVGTEERIGLQRYQEAGLLLDFLVSAEVAQLLRDHRIDGFEEQPLFYPTQP